MSQVVGVGVHAPSMPEVMVSSPLPLPKSLDYRNAVPAVLTGVKDQGMCGSCWAHAATEQIETYNLLEAGLTDFPDPTLRELDPGTQNQSNVGFRND